MEGGADGPASPEPFIGSGGSFGSAAQDLTRDAAHFVFDAGDFALPDAGASRNPPDPPGCAVSSRGAASSSLAAMVPGLLLLLGSVRRRSRAGAAPHAT
jgi:MYXO-CTERM domain-containing protein